MSVILRRSLYAKVPIMPAIWLGGCLGHAQPAAAPEQSVVARDTTGLPGIAAEQFVERDTTLRAAVARYLVGHYADYYRVRIDDQPLPPSLDGTAVRSDGATKGDGVEAKVVNLQSVGLRLAPLEHCSSALSSSDWTVEPGCPKDKYVLVVFGKPRPGPPERQSLSLIKTPIGLTPNSWSIRVVTSEVGPGGWAILSSDYVFEKRSDSSWGFVGKVLMMTVE